jgi:hypothetical protein
MRVRRVRVVERELTPLAITPKVARRLEAISPSPLAQRMVLERAIHRWIDAESARIQAAWDEHVRKQAQRFGWRWQVDRYR